MLTHQQQFELEMFDETARCVELCQALGVRVAVVDGTLMTVWWKFEDLLERAATYEPIENFAPEFARLRLKKISPQKKAQWAYDDARRTIWMAEELMMRLLWHKHTPEEQKLLAQLITEAQNSTLMDLVRIVYHLGADKARELFSQTAFTVDGMRAAFGKVEA